MNASILNTQRPLSSHHCQLCCEGTFLRPGGRWVSSSPRTSTNMFTNSPPVGEEIRNSAHSVGSFRKLRSRKRKWKQFAVRQADICLCGWQTAELWSGFLKNFGNRSEWICVDNFLTKWLLPSRIQKSRIAFKTLIKYCFGNLFAASTLVV